MSFSPHIRVMVSYIEAHIRDEKVNYKEMEERVGFSETYMRELFGNWEDMELRLSDTLNTSPRKKACEYIRQAKKSDEESRRLMEEMLKKGV